MLLWVVRGRVEGRGERVEGRGERDFSKIMSSEVNFRLILCVVG